MTQTVEAIAQVEPAHYSARYDSRGRFLSYWNQIDQVRRAEPRKLLEVGVGNGFVSSYLRKHEYSVHTVDFDARLKPDTVASVTALPFSNGEFDVACCFQTLEHLPWTDFSLALGQLKRVASRRVLVSLPDRTPYIRLKFGVGFRSNWIDTAIDYPRLLTQVHEFDGEHYWEIGKRGFRLSAVCRTIRSAGLRIESMHRDYDDPYHRFFACAHA